jgi:hypothetical protein
MIAEASMGRIGPSVSPDLPESADLRGVCAARSLADETVP